jgi:hypothetical protein
MGTEATLEKCNAGIMQAAENHGQMGFVKSNYWYCQPTVAPANVPPFN